MEGVNTLYNSEVIYYVKLLKDYGVTHFDSKK